jgi:hypothetical protein
LIARKKTRASINKRIIFIGGSKQIGKTALAKKIQHKLSNAIIINEANISKTLKETMMEIYGKSVNDTSSAEYLYKVQPLENKQLVTAIQHIVEYNNSNIIAVGQFFQQFACEEWIKEMQSFGKLYGYKVEFVFLEKNSSKGDKKVEHTRKNTIFRERVNYCIAQIKKNTKIEKYLTTETL